jgi:hypothetical protein
MKEAGGGWSDPRVVAASAIEQTAGHGFDHDHDGAESRHFALLPALANDELVRLELIMIDWAQSQEAVDVMRANAPSTLVE